MVAGKTVADCLHHVSKKANIIRPLTAVFRRSSEVRAQLVDLQRLASNARPRHRSRPKLSLSALFLRAPPDECRAFFYFSIRHRRRHRHPQHQRV